MASRSRAEELVPLAVYTSGGLFWAFMPFFVGLQIDIGSLSPTQAGSLGSTYLIGFSLASVSSLWWIHVVRWSHAIFAAAGVVALNLLLMPRMHGFAASFITTGLIGVAMGTLWSIAYQMFATSIHPQRSFAVGIAISYVALAATAYAMGRYIVPAAGLAGAGATLALIVVSLSLSALALPKRQQHAISTASISLRAPANVLLALGGIIGSGIAFASIWAFAERIGIGAGLERSHVGVIVSSNLLASAGGSVLATWLGSRVGRLLPLCLGYALMAVAVLALLNAQNVQWYAFGVAGLGLGIGFAMPYEMATLAAADERGRFVALIAAAQGFGSAIGPALGGWAWAHSGVQTLIFVTTGALMLSLLCFTWVSTALRRPL